MLLASKHESRKAKVSLGVFLGANFIISPNRRDSPLVLDHCRGPFLAGEREERKKGVHENKRDPREWDFAGAPFPSHERAKLVLFYNPSAPATRRGEPPFLSGGAIEKRERKGVEVHESGREVEESFRMVGRALRRGWNGCQLVF